MNLLLHESAHNRHGTLYIYYKSKKDNSRINERRIDAQLSKHIDKWINKTFLEQLKQITYGLKKIDRYELLISKLCQSGLISEGYSEEVLLETATKKRISEERIRQQAKRIKKWDAMTGNEQRKFVIYNIEKIVINIVTKEVHSIVFLF